MGREWKINGQPDLRVNSDGAFVEAPEYEDLSWMGVDNQVKLAYMLQDISQSHHFTVTLSKIRVEFPTQAFGNFLPVKNISYAEISYDNLSIPVGIFANMPLLHRRQVGTINLVLYDTATDDIQEQIRNWEAECFPKGKYVNFLSNIAAELKYNSYSVTGKLNKSLSLYVVPTGSTTTSRSYEENGAKLINLSLTVVGFKGNITQGEASSGGGIKPAKNINEYNCPDLISPIDSKENLPKAKNNNKYMTPYTPKKPDNRSYMTPYSPKKPDNKSFMTPYDPRLYSGGVKNSDVNNINGRDTA